MKLLKFQAAWCGPCKLISQVLTTINIPFEVQEIDIDQEEELTKKYNIRGVPTLILLDDKEDIVTTHVGALTKVQFVEKFL